MVSQVYKCISNPHISLAVFRSVWSRDISSADEEEIGSDTVWENLQDTSKNPHHILNVYIGCILLQENVIL
jgi:hypothetical protein